MDCINKSTKLTVLLTTIVIFLLTLSTLLVVNSMDNLWNYGFSAKIAAGLLPYRDFNVVVTPLSLYLIAFFLKVFGSYYIVYAIVGSVMVAFMYYLFYRVSFKINNDKSTSLYISLIALLITFINTHFYTYSTLAVIIVLAIIWLEIGGQRENNQLNVYIGLLLGLLFMTKQNIAFFVVVATVFNVLFCQARLVDKIKILFIRGSVSLSVVLTYFSYLYLNGALYDFIDITFLGLLEFSNKNKVLTSNFMFLFCIIPLCIIVKAAWRLIKNREYGLNSSLFIIISYSIAMLSMAYPILDPIHLSMGALVSLLLINYIYPKKGDVKSTERKNIYLLSFLSLCVAFKFAYLKSEVFTYYNTTVSGHYQFSLMKQRIAQKVRGVTHYVQQQQSLGYSVAILDSQAMVYWLGLGVLNDRFDLLMQGNLGYRGEEKFLNKIKEHKARTKYLIGDLDRFQEIISLRTFVICHYNYIDQLEFDYFGKIEKFYVYEKPEIPKSQPDCDDEIIRITTHSAE